jgi:hypothetical protein
MGVSWSLPAAEDLERICRRIERDNPEAARRVALTIYDGCARLRIFRISDGQAYEWPDGVSSYFRLYPTSWSTS